MKREQGMDSVISRLEAGVEEKRTQFQEGFDAFAARHELTDWEGWLSPYDEETYDFVLQSIGPDDVVIEIGAGDLRLALRLAEQARRVYAVEVNPLLVGAALQAIGFDLPRNLLVICANALDLTFPAGITVAVLLMRHCQHFGRYVDKLRAAGCQRLLTNARWKSGVESIDLTRPGVPFGELIEGWYACRCGAVGYVGRGERSDAPPVEVVDCPACRSGLTFHYIFAQNSGGCINRPPRVLRENRGRERVGFTAKPLSTITLPRLAGPQSRSKVVNKRCKQ